MDFNESVKYLYSLGHETLAMKLGLEAVLTVADACGNPHEKVPAVHIAGTNGKGSTAAMTEAVLLAAGYRVGLYTSPHLVTVTERVRVNGEDISQDDFARLASVVRRTSERLVADNLLETPPTFFEQVTMIAFLSLAECKVDIAVLEVGLGGRLDATNICNSLVTAITPVSLDHQKYLGNSLAEIAGEKAGTIKAGVPVVVAPQQQEAMRAIVARAARLHAGIISVEEEIESSKQLSIEAIDGGRDVMQIGRYRLRYRTEDAEYDARLSLRGRHQVINAITTIHLAEELNQAGLKLSPSEINYGLEHVSWPGRLEMLQHASLSAPLLLDGAHNVASAMVLREFLAEHFSATPITLIFGVMSDKAIDEMIELLFPIAQKIIVTKALNERATEPEVIAEMAGRSNHQVICAGSASEALADASRVTPRNGIICACGSLFLVGEIKSEMTKQTKNDETNENA
jgi:dihydrofolate synthase / folylpolyglutamate synthase